MNETVLSEITIYPVKSCKGISLKEVLIGQSGPHMDRRWMIVNPEGVFMSQRTYPKLAMVHTGLDERFLFLSVPGCTPYMLSLNTSGVPRTVQVWKRQVDALDMGDSVARWLSDFLKTECRLVYVPDDSEHIGFVDRLPLHLISSASMQDLVTRLGKKIRANRFRPNLVVSGFKPFEEDNWKRIQIGEVIFCLEKPCVRCMVPAIDQETMQKNEETITTLATFRKGEKGITFGQLLRPENTGIIACGQKITVLE